MDDVTNEELVRLIQEGKDVKRNQELLWVRNLKLIHIIIHNITGYYKGEDIFQDMEQQAFLGILKAIKQYDPKKGKKFFSYAQYWMQQSIYRYNGKIGFTVRITENMKAQIKQFIAARRAFIEQNNRKPNNEELQSVLGLSTTSFDVLLNTIYRIEVVSFDKNVNPDEGPEETILDYIAGDDDVEVEAIDKVYLRDLHDLLFKAIKILSDDEKEMLIDHFFKGQSLSYIGHARSCSKQNINNHLEHSYYVIRHGKYARDLRLFL